MTAAAGARPALPGFVRWGAIPLLALLLIAFFVYLDFPYDRLRRGLALQLGSALGAQVGIGELGPRLSLFGPGFEAQDVRVAFADGTRLDLSRARVRPAWSLAWLSGTPALHVDAESAFGRLLGVASMGEMPGFDGRLESLDLGALPWARLYEGAAAEGSGEADLELAWTGAVYGGQLQLRARDGSLTLPGVPLALPFATLTADARVGDDLLLDLQSFTLDGPMLALAGSGTIRRRPRVSDAPLQMTAKIEAREASLRPMLQSLGLRLAPDGSAEVRIAGTVASPVVR